MTNRQIIIAAEEMTRTGSGFEADLGRAILSADEDNRDKLASAMFRLVRTFYIRATQRKENRE